MCRETATASQLCVYPNLWLIPSDLVIIKKMIPGYNNVLYRPSSGMRFGLNEGAITTASQPQFPRSSASLLNHPRRFINKVAITLAVSMKKHTTSTRRRSQSIITYQMRDPQSQSRRILY